MPRKKALVFPAPYDVALTTVYFTFDSVHFKEVAAFYASKTPIAGNAGTGVLQYKGYTLPDNSIFFGTNTALKTSVLRFTGVNAEALAQEFLSKQDTAFSVPAQNSFKLVSVTGTIGMSKPRSLVDSSQLQTLFNNFVINQIKTKAAIVDNTLVLGSKTGQMNISVVGVVADISKRVVPQTIVNLGATFKIQETKAGELHELIKGNVAVSLIPLVCFFLLQQISKYNMTVTIDQVRDILFKKSDGENIRVPVSKTYFKTLSKDGQYVAKALAGVRNKITDDVTTDESRKVFFSWLSDLKAAKSSISNSTDFFDKITDICK